MPIRIRDWHVHFENNRSRELQRCDWVPMPNKMDGEGYTELVDHPNGAAHFGAWCAMVQIASRRKPRGHFEQGLADLPKYLARLSRLPVAVFEEVLPRLLQMRW